MAGEEPSIEAVWAKSFGAAMPRDGRQIGPRRLIGAERPRGGELGEEDVEPGARWKPRDRVKCVYGILGGSNRISLTLPTMPPFGPHPHARTEVVLPRRGRYAPAPSNTAVCILASGPGFTNTPGLSRSSSAGLRSPWCTPGQWPPPIGTDESDTFGAPAGGEAQLSRPLREELPLGAEGAFEIAVSAAPARARGSARGHPAG